MVTIKNSSKSIEKDHFGVFDNKTDAKFKSRPKIEEGRPVSSIGLELVSAGICAYTSTRGGKWAGWVINGLGHKWVGCIITHLSIYDPFIYKLIIHYQPNPFN